MLDIVIILCKIAVALGIVLGMVPVLIWAERKGSAFIQDRIGPNRARILGIRMGGFIHNLADVIKLLTKEDIVPGNVNKLYFIMAPAIVMAVALLTFAVIPFADTIELWGRIIPLQVADLNVGILYLIAVASLGIYGIVLGGWSSNNKYSLLGALRSAAQMFSYEIAMGLSIVGILLVFGSVRLNEIVRSQGELLWGFLPKWGVLVQPLGFLLFLVTAFAETNRNPFDLPEGESELVGGYHTEYSSMKFALFFMGEYANVAVGAAIVTSLFFGGWQVPYLPTHVLIEKADMLFPAALSVLAIVLILLGIKTLSVSLTRRYRYNDLRDFEGIVFGVPMVAIGLSIGLFLLFGPVVHFSDTGSRIFAACMQFGTFLIKLVFFAWLFIWVRWTLPRFRYDQLMRLGWKVLMPLALVNIFVTGVIILLCT